MGKRVASIDFGLKRIGIALSDATQMIASPLALIETEKSAEKTLEKIIQALMPYELEMIIVGMPLHLNGKKGFLADEVDHFIKMLEKKVYCPVLAQDERFSTAQAERSLKEGNMSRKKRALVVDKVAAILILQNYLDSKFLK